MDDAFKLRPADVDELAVCIGLLAEAGLPTEDVAIERIAMVAELDGDVVGLIGLEQFESTGLLRSLAVDRRHRNSGLGRTLVRALEKLGVERGIEALWLLTTDADAYFEALGYVRRARAAAPDSIAATAEFTALCPDDAVLMSKPLSALIPPD